MEAKKCNNEKVNAFFSRFRVAGRVLLYLLFYIPYLVVFLVLLLSLFCEVKYDSSIFSLKMIFDDSDNNSNIIVQTLDFLVREIYTYENRLYGILNGIDNINIEAPKKIIETVGLCSLIIGWIIEKLDHSEIGIKYNDILNEVWFKYKFTIAVHFSIVLIGLWLGANSCFEGTILSSFLVVYGVVPQVVVLNTFLFNKAKRYEKAIIVWNKKIKKSKSPEDKKNYLLLLADEISLDTHADSRAVTDCFCENFSEYVKSLNNTSYSSSQKIKEISNVWGRLFSCHWNEKTEIITYLINNMKETDSTANSLLGMGYIYSRLQYHGVSDFSNKNYKVESKLYEIYKEIIEMKMCISTNAFRDFCIFLFALMTWKLFINGNVQYYSKCFFITSGISLCDEMKKWGLLESFFSLINVETDQKQLETLKSFLVL